MYPITENSCRKDLQKLIRLGARNTKIKLDTPHGVTIRSIKSGSGSHKDDVIEGQPGVIEIRRMYAGEVKMFTVSLRLCPRDDDETRRSFLETFSSHATEIKLMTVGSSTEGSPVESSTDVFVVEDMMGTPSYMIAPTPKPSYYMMPPPEKSSYMMPPPPMNMMLEKLFLLKHNIIAHTRHVHRFWRSSFIVRVFYLVVLWVLLLQVVAHCGGVVLFSLFVLYFFFLFFSCMYP
jgi:hypothetical protein